MTTQTEYTTAPSPFTPDRWTITAYWRNPPSEPRPYVSREWTYYNPGEARRFMDTIHADFLFCHAWDRHICRLIAIRYRHDRAMFGAIVGQEEWHGPPVPIPWKHVAVLGVPGTPLDADVFICPICLAWNTAPDDNAHAPDCAWLQQPLQEEQQERLEYILYCETVDPPCTEVAQMWANFRAAP